jgi:hypothetical protein
MASTMTDPVPAITEADATGQVAAIFADIRAVLGVGIVNLVWRHLATIPDALPWAWETLRPHYADGTIAAEAAALLGDLDLPAVPAWPDNVFTAVALHAEDLAMIRAVLAAYDRTNAMALIALSALMGRLNKTASAPGAETARNGATPRVPRTAIPLPSLLNLSDMSPTTAALVLALNRLGTRRDTPILASMYRHLAHWPEYLALAWTLVAPLDADRRLDRAVANATAKALTRATQTAVLPRGTPTPGASAAIRQALEPFTGDVIVKMVVICAILREATVRS